MTHIARMIRLGTIGVLLVIGSRAEVRADELTGAQRLTQRVNAALTADWSEHALTPTAVCSDAAYLRRLSLDLRGVIPSAAEVREFLRNPSATKRRDVANDYLGQSSYVVFQATRWRDVMLPDQSSSPGAEFYRPMFTTFLRQQLAANTPYDEIMRTIVTADASEDRFASAFYFIREMKPEELASATARVFLGQRIECAQCHDHPMDEWKQEQFWQFATFYAQRIDGSQQTGAAGLAQKFFSRKTLVIPGTEQVVRARFLDGERPQHGFDKDPRESLADWLALAARPQMAAALGNRMWQQFFGRGVIDPVDDFGPANPPLSQPLLNALTQSVLECEFDLRQITLGLVATDAYQLSSATSDTEDSTAATIAETRFSRMPVRALSAEQLFASVARATGGLFEAEADRPFARSDAQRFRQLFREAGTAPVDRESSVLQALIMMNGGIVADATSVAESRLLRGILEIPGLTRQQRLEAMCLATVNRLPTDEDRSLFLSYLDGVPEGETDQAFADVYWVLLNSSEFRFNH